MIDAPVYADGSRQRRDISTLEIGQWPCASRDLMYRSCLIPLERSHRLDSSTARLFHAMLHPALRNRSLRSAVYFWPGFVAAVRIAGIEMQSR